MSLLLLTEKESSLPRRPVHFFFLLSYRTFSESLNKPAKSINAQTIKNADRALTATKKVAKHQGLARYAKVCCRLLCKEVEDNKKRFVSNWDSLSSNVVAEFLPIFFSTNSTYLVRPITLRANRLGGSLVQIIFATSKRVTRCPHKLIDVFYFLMQRS